MNIPGFTAEASLFHGDVRYQSTAEANIYRGIVQPAGLFDPGRPVPFLSSQLFNPNRPIFCLKFQCVDRPNRNPFCFRVLGFWNPVTSSCE